MADPPRAPSSEEIHAGIDGCTAGRVMPSTRVAGLRERLADHYLPLVQETDPEARRILARSLLDAHSYLLLFGLLLTAAYLRAGLWWSGGALGAWVVALLLTPAVMRALPVRVTCGVSLLLLLAATLVGGAVEPPAARTSLAPLVVAPFSAFLFFGRRAGWRWALGAIGAGLGLRLLLAAHPVAPAQPTTPALVESLRAVGVFFLLVGLGANRERSFELLLRRARAAVDAKSTFLANISHEIRTPLNGVMGMTEVMLMDEDRPRRRDQLEVIQRSGRHLLKIINELLDLTRAERGQLVLEHTAFSLEQMLRETLALYQPQAQLRGLELRLSLPLGMPQFVTGDDFRLRQMLGNLINNALKFTEQGTVVVRLYRLTQTRWRFEVEDSGIGIPLASLPQLFTPFKQADSSTARRFGGTGLGLALVRVLARQMGGDAGARSVEGKGSVFSIDVPLPVAPAPDIRMPERPTPTAVRTEVPVLVVDDNPVNLRIAAALLARAGCRVTQATNGADALTLAAEHRFVAIFMDCQMPGIDGWEATRRLRASAHSATVPVIALTASAMAQDVAACLEAGMNEVLPKPVTYDALKGALARYVEGGTLPKDPDPSLRRSA